MSERIQALHALRAFEVASRYGSFTRAAEELALTQGAVSHHIKTLESMFGCSLFERR
ncbi:MAG: LysR family transcriptional regulator, partial [Pseudomonas sp.]